MQISFPISKYSKMRRQGVEVQTLGHTNLFTKVLCDPVNMSRQPFLVISPCRVQTAAGHDRPRNGDDCDLIDRYHGIQFPESDSSPTKETLNVSCCTLRRKQIAPGKLWENAKQIKQR